MCCCMMGKGGGKGTSVNQWAKMSSKILGKGTRKGTSVNNWAKMFQGKMGDWEGNSQSMDNAGRMGAEMEGPGMGTSSDEAAPDAMAKATMESILEQQVHDLMEMGLIGDPNAAR